MKLWALSLQLYPDRLLPEARHPFLWFALQPGPAQPPTSALCLLHPVQEVQTVWLHWFQDCSITLQFKSIPWNWKVICWSLENKPWEFNVKFGRLHCGIIWISCKTYKNEVFFLVKETPEAMKCPPLLLCLEFTCILVVVGPKFLANPVSVSDRHLRKYMTRYKLLGSSLPSSIFRFSFTNCSNKWIH